MQFSYQPRKSSKSSQRSRIKCGGCQKQFRKGDLRVSFSSTRHIPGSECTYHLDCYKDTFTTISKAQLSQMIYYGILPQDRKKVVDFWTRCDQAYREAQTKKRKHELLLDTDPEVKKAPKSSFFGPFPTDIWENILSFTGDVNSVINLGITCRDAYELSNLDSIWKRLLDFNIVDQRGVSIVEKLKISVPHLTKFESKPLFVELYSHICRECGLFCRFGWDGTMQQDFRNHAEEQSLAPTWPRQQSNVEIGKERDPYYPPPQGNSYKSLKRCVCEKCKDTFAPSYHLIDAKDARTNFLTSTKTKINLTTIVAEMSNYSGVKHFLGINILVAMQLPRLIRLQSRFPEMTTIEEVWKLDVKDPRRLFVEFECDESILSQESVQGYLYCRHCKTLLFRMEDRVENQKSSHCMISIDVTCKDVYKYIDGLRSYCWRGGCCKTTGPFLYSHLGRQQNAPILTAFIPLLIFEVESDDVTDDVDVDDVDDEIVVIE